MAKKHQDKHSFAMDDQAEQMGADMAIQFMMTLLQIVSEMAEDPRGFRSDVHKELSGLLTTYKLPLMPEATTQKNSRLRAQDPRRHHDAVVRAERGK